MVQNRFKVALLLCAAAVASSCSSGQQLVAIQVTPTTVVFGAPDPSLHVQLTAIGTYSHPPATKDITSQVTWTSSVTQVAQVNTAGVVSPTNFCGTAGVTATLKTNSPTGNIITGSTTITVDGPAADNCPTTTP